MGANGHSSALTVCPHKGLDHQCKRGVLALIPDADEIHCVLQRKGLTKEKLLGKDQRVTARKGENYQWLTAAVGYLKEKNLGLGKALFYS